MHLVKRLKGHSGATVSLYKDKQVYKVVKENYSKAIESVNILNSLPFSTPEVYQVTNNKIVMEHINGQDMKSYLESATISDVNKLISFIEDYFNFCLENSKISNFTNSVNNKIKSLESYINLNGKVVSCYYNMPKSIIHGDLTLENILFSNNKFYLIDANPTDLSSVYFDGNKLRQDIDCLWFVRNERNKLNYSINCSRISNELKNKFPFLLDDQILIFMLSRILPYSKNQNTTDFLYKEIDKRWQ